MIIYNKEQLANLQETVLYLLNKVDGLEEVGGVLNAFGLKVIDQIDSTADLPSVQSYIASQEALGRDLEDLYGDAIAIGTQPPYQLVIFTRAFSGATEPEWFNIGEFPKAGPQGIQGIQGDRGEQGERGSMWTTLPQDPVNVSGFKANDAWFNSVTGDVFAFNGNSWIRQGNVKGPQGVQGIQGKQGIQGVQGPIGLTGPQGPSGQSFKIAGELTDPNQLPVPTEENRSFAYLIGNETDGFEMWVVVGISVLNWRNVGRVEGVQGPQGPVGPKGDQGPKGADGEDGVGINNVAAGNVTYGDAQTITPIVVSLSNGTNKSFNVVAQRGPQGLVGPKGDKGDRGLTGAQGPKGDQGPQGPAGTVDYTQIYTKNQVDGITNSLQSSINNRIDTEVSELTGDISDVDNRLTASENALESSIEAVNQTATQTAQDLSTTQTNLTNNYYTKTEVNNIVGEINQFKVQFVTSLPSTGNPLTIYFVAIAGSDNYNEYMYVNDKWEQIGSTSIDLSNYYTQAQTNQQIANAKTQLEAEIDGVSDAVSSLQETVVTKTDQASKVYGTDSIGLDYEYSVTDAITGFADIPLRRAQGGQVQVGEPILNADAATKAYVDQATFKVQKLSNQDIGVYAIPTGFYEVENIALTFSDLPLVYVNGVDRDSSTYRYVINRGFLTVSTSGGSNGVFTLTKDITNETIEDPFVTGSYWINRPTSGGNCVIIEQKYIEQRLNNVYTKQQVDDLIAGAGGGSVEFADSATIVVSDTETGAKQFNLSGDIVNDIASSLKAPAATDSKFRMVGIEANSTDQTLKQIGSAGMINVVDNGTEITIGAKLSDKFTVNSLGKLIPAYAQLNVSTETVPALKPGSVNEAYDTIRYFVSYSGLVNNIGDPSNYGTAYYKSKDGFSVQFLTGETPAVTATFATSFIGDDCENGVFTPQANTYYELHYWWFEAKSKACYIASVTNYNTHLGWTGPTA